MNIRLPQRPSLRRRRIELAVLAACLLTAGCASGPVAIAPAGAANATASAPGSVERSGTGTTPAPERAAAPEAPAASMASARPEAAAASPAPTSTHAVSTESTVIAIDPMEPTVRIDLDNAQAQSDLWARVRTGFKMADLDNDLVRKWEQWYTARPDYMQRMTERGGRYMFHIVNELERRGMPSELALLPFIESAYNPQAMSVAKASGMWQFIPGTGRDFSLKQNIFRDDRRDVLASTRAALDYLKMLHGMFGDWHLALAAYNWGQGSVQRAVTRSRQAGGAGSYEQLQMPDETRNYVPKLQAVKNIVARPESFSVALAPLKNHPYFISVGIDRDIDVERAAKMAALPLDEFKALNPQMNKPLILAAGTPQVLLPYDNANLFVRALAQHKGPLASWTAWVAPRTMRPAQVAEQVGMAEAQLRELNRIPPGMLVKAGSTLLVPRNAQRQADVEESVADNATLALAPDLPPFKRVSFKAGRSGDSVAAVARRYRVTVNQVAAWNQTSASGRFKPGQAVVLLLPQRPVLAKSSTARVQVAKGGAAATPTRSAAARKPARPAPAARMRR